MAFGDVSRWAVAPAGNPSGMGGDSSKIWHTSIYVDKIYELLTSDFSVFRQVAAPSTSPYGIGGNSSTIWHCDLDTELIYELATSDFSVVRSAASPDALPYGIGGDSSTIWHCAQTIDRVYELLTSDFSVFRQSLSPDFGPTGIGGDSSTIWHCDKNIDKVYELATSDFSVVQSAASPVTGPTGIGGTSGKIWHCDETGYPNMKVYELETGILSPTTTTDPATSVEATAATGNGNITDNGGEDCDKRGFVYDTSPHGDPGDTAPADSEYADYVEETDSFGIGAFTGTLTSLEPSTPYYVRAYAHNSAGYSYGDEVSFTTLVATPTVTTSAATGLGAIAATLNGTLADDGGEEACDCGFEWGPDVGKGITTPTESKTKGQTFSQVIGGLAPNTTYHFRALATNSAGTGHGADRTFTTALIISRAFALARSEL